MSPPATLPLRNFIDGEFVDAAEGATTPVLNPATGEEIGQAPASGPAGGHRPVPPPPRALPGRAAPPPGERALALLKLADLIEEHGDELATLEADNAGKPIEAVKSHEGGGWGGNM